MRNMIPTKPIPVIVRAWGNEPVRSYLHRIENNRCIVGSENANNPISLPPDQVFAFTIHTFSTMVDMYQKGNIAELREVYANLRDDLACNRYQDSLDSSHDQEHLTDSERAASGNTQ